MTKNKKGLDKIIRSEFVADIKYDLEGRIDIAIELLKKLREEYGPTTYIEVGAEAEKYSYSDKEYPYVRVYFKREETDEEFETRKANEEARRLRVEANERAVFERLKKQFGE